MSDEKQPMRVLGLYAENIKKLRAVEIHPHADVVVIAGANGNGKTSILDSIWWALAGTANIQGQPIRKGAKKAKIRLDLGGTEVELVVERRFTDSGSTLTVESPDGARFKSPQDLLNSLYGALAFDPLEFTRMKARDQFDTLRRLVDVGIDFAAVDAANKSDFERRAAINKEAKAKRAQAEAIQIPTGTPKEPIDESALLTKMEEAGQRNTERGQRMARRQEYAAEAKRHRDSIPAHHAKIADLRAEIEMQERFIAAAEKKATDLENQLKAADPLPDEIDVTAVRQELEAARSTNALVAQRAKRRDLEDEAEALESNAEALTNRMAKREEEKQAAIAAAKMPVPGLGFGDGVVTFNGVPIDQASSAEQLRVSMAIAMSANPRLRVLRIQDGSLLDENSLALVTDLAREHNYQVWLEKVDTSGKIGVVIEDGEVVKVDGQPA